MTCSNSGRRDDRLNVRSAANDDCYDGAARAARSGPTAPGGEDGRRESARLEANKRAAASLLVGCSSAGVGVREYRKFARVLNASINVHNSVHKPYRVSPLPV